MSGAPPRALLLDLYGTLLELREPPAAVYTRFAARHGIAREHAAVERALANLQIGPPPLEGVPLAAVPERERAKWREGVRAALGDAAADGPCFDALFAHYGTAEPWRVLPDALDALRTARSRGLALGVVSNMDFRTPGMLAALGLAPLLDALALPSTSGFAKPDPRSFRAALERLGLRPDEGLYIGDREVDCVAAARAAGLRALRLDRSGARGEGILSGWADLARVLG